LNVAPSLCSIEIRLARRVAYSLQQSGTKRNASGTGQAAGEKRGGHKASRAQAPRVVRDGYDDVGRRPRSASRLEEEAHRETLGTGVEKPRRRWVLEVPNALEAKTPVEGSRANRGERRRGAAAPGAESSSRRGLFLASSAEISGDEFDFDPAPSAEITGR
jgi:hypothetical protein